MHRFIEISKLKINEYCENIIETKKKLKLKKIFSIFLKV